MKVLNLLRSGGVGGIEVLCENIGEKSTYENTFCFIFDEGAVFDEMKRENHDVVSYARIGKQLSIKKFIRLLSLSKNYDIITLHHNDIFMQVYFILLKVFNKSPKYVATIHTCFDKTYYYYNSKIKTFLRKNILIKSLHISDLLVFVSQAGRNSYLKEFEINMDKTTVVYNGIDGQLIKKGMKNKLNNSNEYMILFVGRLTKAKGVHLLIEAVNKIISEYSVKLVLVGDGPEKKNLELMAKNFGLMEAVTFEGMQRDVDKYRNSANIFVYPSICKEIFGISIVESMAYGLPCIANRVGGIPEIIKDGENGFLTDEISADGIAKAITNVLNLYKTGEILRISENGKITAKRFSIQNTLKSLENVYSNLI